MNPPEIQLWLPDRDVPETGTKNKTMTRREAKRENVQIGEQSIEEKVTKEKRN